MAELHPKYQGKIDGSYYRLPKEGQINDGVRIDKGADKWGLSRESDGRTSEFEFTNPACGTILVR